MRLDAQETIAALASPPGGAARAIIRVSGPKAVACLESIFEPTPLPVPAPHSPWRERGAPTVLVGELRVARPIARVPVELYWWPGRRSYTRQPTAELHLFGSPPLVAAVLASLAAAGARPAEPGEFTLRAFLAGRIDLPQAEAILGVIDAHGQRELDVALEQLAGGLGAPLRALREQLLDALAQLEAGLDFVEEDIEFITAREVERQLDGALEQLDQISQRMRRREESRSEYRVVLRGAPNVGKSSVLNALAGESAALVADVPGTTRDYVTRTIRCAGLECRLIDTAGFESTVSEVSTEAAAQSLALAQAARADLELFCLDGSRGMTAEEQAYWNSAAPTRRLVVITKADLPRRILAPPIRASGADEHLRVDSPQADLHSAGIPVSSHSGQGLDELRRAIAQLLESEPTEGGLVASTAARCHDSVRAARDGLQRARHLLEVSGGEELIAAELRAALEALGHVVGAVYTDDILDRIFSRFCIGK